MVCCDLSMAFDRKHEGLLFKLTLLLQNMTCRVLGNSVDPDQLACGSALFVIKYVNFYQTSVSSNLIG